MVCCGCHQAPAAAVGTPDNRTQQVVSLIPAAFTGTRPTSTDLAVASVSKCAAPAKLARCPPRQRPWPRGPLSRSPAESPAPRLPSAPSLREEHFSRAPIVVASAEGLKTSLN
jgi:hypothetical protein